MSYSDYLSIIALLISAISLCISWRQHTRDRSRLKFKIRFELESGFGTRYLLNIVNVGRRSTTIKKCDVYIKPDNQYPLSESSTLLEETDSIEVPIPLNSFRDEISHPLDIEAIKVYETTGKTHIVKTNKLRKEINRLWNPETDWLNK